MRLLHTVLLCSLLAAIIPAGVSLASEPDVVASRWIIVDAETGAILDSADPDTAQPMASLTKVMTALVAIEHSNLDMLVTVTSGDLIGESSAGLVSGDVVTLRTLLYGLLLRSGNDAAMAIARSVGGSNHIESDAARTQFVGWMNRKAEELELHNTHFMNPHGLDQDAHYSSAHDLATLTRNALEHPVFREIFSSVGYYDEGYEFQSGNYLPDLMSGVIGGKTGWTDGCGLCLIEVAEQNGREIVVVLLSSDWSWYEDALALFKHAQSLQMPATSVPTASIIFQNLWNRTDLQVEQGKESRTWVWGKPVLEISEEESSDSDTGLRYEQLFEKGSMEINQPTAPLDTEWYVTAGRLAAIMIDEEADVPLAGDLDAIGPTYADARILQQVGAHEPGTLLTQYLSPTGSVHIEPEFARYGIEAGSTEQTGHAVATVFEEFMWQTVTVYEQSDTVPGLLFEPPIHAIGYPIIEPYWTTVPIAGTWLDVLVQCFERRCLTYTPTNPVGWQVEMSNIGLHWALWQGNISLVPLDPSAY